MSTEKATVPLSQPLERGTVGHPTKWRDGSWDSAETVDLKALARNVLSRSEQRDTSGTGGRDRCPTPQNTVGHLSDPVPPPPREADAGDVHAEFEERAALIEYGAGVPRAWAEGFARLDLSSPPKGFDARRWRQLIDNGGRFLDRWAARAAQLGWLAEDVFGVHPLAPAANYSLMGLVPLIGDGEVTDIGDGGASIRMRFGSILVYLRRPQKGAVTLWELNPWSGGRR